MTGAVVITGAAGFIGRHTVAYARSLDIPVRAVVRHDYSTPETWAPDRGISVHEGDLSKSPNLSNALEGASAVIHAAATLSRDHARDTITASQALIDALEKTPVPHVVLVSSISVYDVDTLEDHGTLSEETPLLAAGRDAYSAAKLRQEQMFRTAAALHGFELTILRPGAVFGPGRLWNAHIGPALGPVLAMIDGGGTVPLAEVDLVAECLVRAARAPEGIDAINIVDDALPGRDRFLAAFRACGWPRVALHVPLSLARLAARIAPEGPRMPGLLRRPVLEARHKPLHYANRKMHNRLGPVTMLPFETAMMRAIEIEQDLAQ